MLRLRRGRVPENGSNSKTPEENKEEDEDEVRNAGAPLSADVEEEVPQTAILINDSSSNIPAIGGVKRYRDATLHSFFGRSISSSQAASLK